MPAPVVIALLAAAPLAAPAPDPPEVRDEAPRWAALPLRNGTPALEQGTELWRLVEGALASRGARFLPAEDLERFLRRRRIRYTDSLTVADARALFEEQGVRYVLAGALLAFVPGPLPEISLAVRTLDTETGARVQSAVVTMRGDDTQGLLGLGRIDDPRELSLEVVARVLDGFGPDARPLARGERPPRPGGVESSFRAEGFDPGAIRRVAILPPANRTGRPEAAAHLVEQVAHQWYRMAGVEVVEPSELRAALVRARVRSLDALDGEVLSVIGREVDARYFSLGSVDRYAPGVFTAHGTLPEVEASVRVLDVEDQRIVAAASVRRRGDHYHALLGLGNVRSLGDLAERVSAELVGAITR